MSPDSLLDATVRQALIECLERARRHGALGPGSVEPHIDHALAFASLLAPPPDRFLDLGSGGGLPGLVLARAWPDARGTLLDSQSRRTRDLEASVRALDLGDRIDVLLARAEQAAHDPAHREAYDLVVARSFGPPAVSAECGAPFLRVGGALVVSEPPGDETAVGERWPHEGLSLVGLEPGARRSAGNASFIRLIKARASAPDHPRGVGRPGKAPLW